MKPDVGRLTMRGDGVADLTFKGRRLASFVRRDARCAHWTPTFGTSRSDYEAIAASKDLSAAERSFFLSGGSLASLRRVLPKAAEKIAAVLDNRQGS